VDRQMLADVVAVLTASSARAAHHAPPRVLLLFRLEWVLSRVIQGPM
jgi:hypothetical protein